MIGRIFWLGVKTIIPFALTVAIIYWLCAFIEHFFGTIVQWIIGPAHYFPGLGFIVGIIVTFIIGMVVNAYFLRWIHLGVEKIFKKIPLVKTLYNSLKELMNAFSKDAAEKMGKVVIFEWQGIRMMGMVTREDFNDLPEGVAASEEVAVYLPLAYQIGGFMVMIPRDRLQEIDMKSERAMRYIITAGMVGAEEQR